MHQDLSDYASAKIAGAILRRHGVDSVYEAMVERYGKPRGWVHVDELDDLARDFRKRDQTYKVWRSLENLDGGVNNGGFDGYFSNGLGYQFLTAIDSARIVGDHGVAQLLEELRKELAAKGFEEEFSEKQYVKLEDALEDVLNKYSRRYYATGKKLLARSELYLASKLCSVDLLAKISDQAEPGN
jgi:hypothetical protein